ncbi:Aureobasidin resistance protein Aur1 [Podila clonocystis]|nr:Aureobasidin resistance protein Aur1 [Podila clonocystis]
MTSLSSLLSRSLQRLQRATRAATLSTLRPLQQHQYTIHDLQYVFLLILFVFCYLIMDKPVWFKLPIALATKALLIPRRSRLFMLPFLAVAAWLVLFYCCRFIPAEWRPHIFTSVLPALENILYGGNISEMLAISTSPFKDLLAWLPYGVLHYVLPVVAAVLMVYFAPPGTLPVFARTFGYMNVAGVITQIVFPCAPPWYETRYGPVHPATYSMPGDPGGLSRVDDILGLNMYKTTFTASPLVFGAFPSLHSACAWQIAFFLVFTFGPRAIPFVMAYVFWIWWATMYLGHHYVVDLVGGGAYAVVAFWFGSYFLPTLFHSSTNSQYQDQRSNGKSITIDLEDLSRTGDRHEKQLLFDANMHEEDIEDEDDGQGSSGGSSGGISNSHNSSTTSLSRGEGVDLEEESPEAIDQISPLSFNEGRTIDMDRIVVEIPDTEPLSPTGSSSSHTSHSTRRHSKRRTTGEKRQSWGGWQGYESWIDVLAAVNSPKTSPRSSPKNSPLSSPRSSSALGGSESPFILSSPRSPVATSPSRP